MKRDAQRVVPNADIELWHSADSFLHRGTSGQWREVFTDEDLARYDARMHELAPHELVDWVQHMPVG